MKNVFYQLFRKAAVLMVMTAIMGVVMQNSVSAYNSPLLTGATNTLMLEIGNRWGDEMIRIPNYQKLGFILGDKPEAFMRFVLPVGYCDPNRSSYWWGSRMATAGHLILYGYDCSFSEQQRVKSPLWFKVYDVDLQNHRWRVLAVCKLERKGAWETLYLPMEPEDTSYEKMNGFYWNSVMKAVPQTVIRQIVAQR